MSAANQRSTPEGAEVNGSRFASLITLRVLEPALARCKNSNKFGFRSLTRSFVSLLFALYSVLSPSPFRHSPLGSGRV